MRESPLEVYLLAAARNGEQRSNSDKTLFIQPPRTMASLRSATKAFTLPPTVRALPSGVPAAKYINLNARAPADEHGHGHGHGASTTRTGPPSKWAAGIQLSSGGLSTKTFTTSASQVSISEVV